MAARVEAYVNAGLPKAKAESAAKNEKTAASLDGIIAGAAIKDASKNPKQGSLLLHLATSGQELPLDDQVMLGKMVADGRIQNLDQLNGRFTSGLLCYHLPKEQCLALTVLSLQFDRNRMLC